MYIEIPLPFGSLGITLLVLIIILVVFIVLRFLPGM